MESAEEICAKLLEVMQMRAKYPCQTRETRPDVPVEIGFGKDGLMHVWASASQSASALTPNGCTDGRKELFPVPSLDEYYQDMETLFHIRSAGPVSSYCQQRLRLMQTKFELYQMVSSEIESEQAMSTAHRDFYNVRKVDTHVHHSAAMNAKHLLRFMKKKLKTASDDVVDVGKDGTPRTLKQVFDAMGVQWSDLSLDKLQVWADKSCLHRFDRFNNKYSPMGHNDLRTIFLKTDNAMGGRYLAELTRQLLDDLEESKYQHVEWRLSIYGRKRSEWEGLARWVLGEGKGLGEGRALLSPNLRWMIQIPRLFSLYRGLKQLNNFGEMLENIFAPIFEATLDPAAHPHVARFLEQISGFDTVDDESKSQNPVDRTFSSKTRTPWEWDIADNPSYKYYSYFIHANISVLNRLRAMRGLNQFSYRPHAGEAGEVHHLDTAFLLADGINHGLNLRKSPPLQYLFYLAQIGVAMSPCSNNQLFLAYEKSPFPVYFIRGLNVSLSTDDPLMFHQTKEPLMEEYSIAKQLWHLTSVDLCEIARNSVLQSGFPDAVKENTSMATNVPNIRIRFRNQVHNEEMRILRQEVSWQEQEDSVRSMLLLSPLAHPAKGPAGFALSRVSSLPPPLPGEELQLGPEQDLLEAPEGEAPSAAHLAATAASASDLAWRMAGAAPMPARSLSPRRSLSDADAVGGPSSTRRGPSSSSILAQAPNQVAQPRSVLWAALAGALAGALLALLASGRGRWFARFLAVLLRARRSRAGGGGGGAQ